MDEQIMATKEEMLKRWTVMQQSSIEESSTQADQFERSFYLMVTELKKWYHQLANKPKDLDEVLQLPLIMQLEEELPAPLLLNFETELELIIDGIDQEDDEV